MFELTPADADITHSANILPPRFAPLRALPFSSVLRAKCCDCGREQEHSVGRLVREARLADRTAEQIAAALTCQRMNCGGRIEADIDLYE